MYHCVLSRAQEAPSLPFTPVIHYSYVIYYLQDIHSTKGTLLSRRAATFLKWVSDTFPTVVSSMYTLTYSGNTSYQVFRECPVTAGSHELSPAWS